MTHALPSFHDSESTRLSLRTCEVRGATCAGVFRYFCKIVAGALFLLFLFSTMVMAGTIPVDAIKKAVKETIFQKMPWNPEDVTIVSIEVNTVPDPPEGKITFQVAPNPTETYVGRAVIPVYLAVDGKPFRRIWVNATLSVMADVVTVVRPLGKNQPIDASAVMVSRRDLKNLPPNAVRRVEDAVGNRTTRMIYPNTVLQTDMVAAQPLVKRGDVVRIIARSDEMVITAMGTAKQQGARDDRVRVVNNASNRVVIARVVGPGIVQVDF